MVGERRAVRETLAARARRELPNESCGLLLLDGDRVIYTIEVPAQSRGTLELDPGYGDVVIDGQPFSGAGQGPRDLLSAGPHEVTFRMAR